MPSPATPKAAAIISRIVTVLSAITAGTTYWYTPARVQKRYVHWREHTGGFPLYMVSIASGGARTPNSHANVDQTINVSIKGYVKDNLDTTDKIIKCIQDILVALTAEMENGAAGSLPVLGAIQCHMTEFPETDEGYLIIENGLGFFNMQVEIQYNDVTGYI